MEKKKSTKQQGEYNQQLTINNLTRLFMRMSKYPKIPRHRVPNLKYLVQTPKSDSVAQPIFFNKIQNSLKLLEDATKLSNEIKSPQKNRQPNIRDIKFKIRIQHHPIIKKQRFSSLDNLSSLGYQFKSFNDIKTPQSLPPMQKVFKKYEKAIRSSTSRGQSEYRPNKNTNRVHSLNNQLKTQPLIQYQQIASTSIAKKSFEQIIAEKEEEEKRRRQYVRETSEQDSQNGQDYNDNKKKMEGRRMIQKDEIEGNYKRRMENIVKGEENVYDILDRNMMKKVNVYKSRKAKIDLKLTWR